MHCHEIMVHKRRLYITSTGFDSILAFDLDKNEFCFGLHLVDNAGQVQGGPFDPNADKGPKPSNTMHINNNKTNENNKTNKKTKKYNSNKKNNTNNKNKKNNNNIKKTKNNTSETSDKKQDEQEKQEEHEEQEKQ